MGDAVAGAGERVGDVGPGVDTATSAGFDDAEFGGIGGASLFGARAEAEAAGDDGMPQGAFRLVVCRRQRRIADEGDDGGPVVENFSSELADFLGVVVAMELARPLEPGLDRIEDGMVLVVGYGPDQVAQLAHQPLAEADAVRVEAASQSQAFPDEMGQAALAAGIIAIGAVAIGDQPTQDASPSKSRISSWRRLPIGRRGGGGQHHPQPAAQRALEPRRLIGMETPAARTSCNNSSTIGSQATPTSRRQRSREPTESATPNHDSRNSRMRRRDWWWRTAKAVMKAASDGPIRQRSLTSRSRRALPGTTARPDPHGRRLLAAGTTHHLIAMQHAGDADAAAQPLQLEDRESLRRADHASHSSSGVPHRRRCKASGSRCVPFSAAHHATSPWLLAACRACAGRTLVPSSPEAIRKQAIPWRRRQRRPPDCRHRQTADRTRRPRTVGRIHRQTLGLLDHHGLEPAKQLDKLRVI